MVCRGWFVAEYAPLFRLAGASGWRPRTAPRIGADPAQYTFAITLVVNQTVGLVSTLAPGRAAPTTVVPDAPRRARDDIGDGHGPRPLHRLRRSPSPASQGRKRGCNVCGCRQPLAAPRPEPARRTAHGTTSGMGMGRARSTVFGGPSPIRSGTGSPPLPQGRKRGCNVCACRLLAALSRGGPPRSRRRRSSSSPSWRRRRVWLRRRRRPARRSARAA